MGLQTLFTKVGAGETVGHSFSTLTALLAGYWTSGFVLVLKSCNESVVISKALHSIVRYLYTFILDCQCPNLVCLYLY